MAESRPSAKPKTANSTKAAKKTLKHWVAVTLFAAIIVVFALWGIRPDRYSDSSTGGGVAAVVNETPISMAEFHSRVENVERNANMRFDQFPEAQRRAFQQQMRQRTLEELIMMEAVYQAADKHGVTAPDGEIRDVLLREPGFQENGRFQKDRYQAYLQNTNTSAQELERQIRKQIVNRKLQELFIGSATPTREEVKRTVELASQKVKIRYVELTDDDLKKPGFVSEDEVGTYLGANKAEVEGYYKNNIVEFTQPEKARARHILIRIDEKRPDAEAAKVASEIRKKITPQNFAKIASESSEDPGSKAKGGDLGEFERGRMVPEFEKATFALKDGEISQPIKTPFGYHIIYMEKKTAGGVQTFDQVKTQVARKLLVNRKMSDILAKVKTQLEKGNKKDIEALVAKAGLKWQDSGEFDLSSASIPKLADSEDVLTAIMKHGKSGGILPDFVAVHGGHVIVDVLSWKEVPTEKPQDELERSLAYRKSNDLLEAWAKEVAAKADVQRNARVTQ